MGTWTLDDVTLRVVRGNLAEQDVDAVAIGVGEDLLPDGPASGAVFSAAGDRLVQHLDGRGPIEPGEVETVPGFDLPTETILLCSMRPRNGIDSPGAFLRSCVRNVLRRAGEEQDLGVVSLQPLGLGDYGYPVDRVSRAHIRTIVETVDRTSTFEEIRLVVYDVVEFSSVDTFAKTILEGPSGEKGKGNRPNLQF